MMTPQQYGVGARLTLSVYSDHYVEVILDALGQADSSGLEIETNDVSTYIQGDEERILNYLRDVIAAAAATKIHIGANVLLSRGCPGELACELPAGSSAIGKDALTLPATGIRARADWSIYPLLDGGHDGEHMTSIYQAIDLAKRNGTYKASHHFATLLDGDLADVLATAASGWLIVGQTVQHVVTHLTISINSPTVITD